eukprot:m.89175 g.89175  ORF g.89175 m.89175 type:complete len:111 (+) comp51028_c0_seq1:222-554(+)
MYASLSGYLLSAPVQTLQAWRVLLVLCLLHIFLHTAVLAFYPELLYVVFHHDEILSRLIGSKLPSFLPYATTCWPPPTNSTTSTSLVAVALGGCFAMAIFIRKPVLLSGF